MSTNPEQPPAYLSQLRMYMPLREFVKRILLLGSLIVLALTLWELRLILLMTFLAIIIAVSLDIPVRRLQSYGMRRGIAMLIVMVITILVLALLVTVIGTPIVTQSQNLIEDLPSALQTLRDNYEARAERSTLLPNINFDRVFSSGSASGVISPDAVTGSALLVTSVGSFVLSLAVNFIVIIIVSMYLLAEPQTYANSVLALIPKTRQETILRIMVDLRQALVEWLVSQLISMFIITVLVWFTLGVIWEIPNAVALGILSGVLAFIPNFGSVIAAIPGIIFTLAEKPEYVVPVILTYIIVQQFESNFITPMIIKRRLSIPAAALLVFQVICGVLFGFLGLLLAVPLFMVVVVLVRELYVDMVLDNLNTAIESHRSEEGDTVLRVTSEHFTTQEIPLKHIFNGDGPIDRSIKEVIESISRREQDGTPVHLDQHEDPIEERYDIEEDYLDID
jgi:predicted PurR-regulated permease PerM